MHLSNLLIKTQILNHLYILYLGKKLLPLTKSQAMHKYLTPIL